MRTPLLVEDNEPVANRLAGGLRDAGHTVHIAADAMAALHALRFVRPDLILLNIGLPEMGGLQLLRTLRATPAGASIPVAIVTATDAAIAEARSADLGVVSVISKHRDSLQEIVRHVNELLESPSA